MSTLDLFADEPPMGIEPIGPQSVVLRGHALPHAAPLLAAVDSVMAQAPLRHLVTPGGFTMSVAMTNCGALGWTSDRRGYRYSAIDPVSGQSWPAMPAVFAQLAGEAAAAAGFEGFAPDACLINQYLPGSRLSLHQDRDERDLDAPIVSVSLGMPATFLFGGLAGADKTARVLLQHGDVVVWGGVDRLRHHGVLPLKDQPHLLLGGRRINLTFRKAG
ncbi:MULTISPECIES: DNA oxidative demethylase AlkB [Delftia]|uniref:DNA oxidative demethylase AlkB n=1 Tax=Delftia TaxID=80865 RepID=UPI000929BFE2|nr:MULTISPECIES: DNA oxidative demethylase AlkB [Delftia]MDH0423335.1 DNA oxidative demethylase AlkB [Delftia tsuruhatensis]OJX12334.1 MAG: alpha-ketoglutarate-dependent dioxygenase AlkB [Delftia sp. 67-8]QFS65502.1 DNA oxidative demethylase AlkB [Delftia tsuruhatensis]WON87072.1 DNA oxidative demethylase AlkB [Delftia sp. UGAL515B_04]